MDHGLSVVKVPDLMLLAWMAGFVDADGSIGIVSVGKTRNYRPKLTVCNTNYEAVLVFEKEFGGKVRKRVWKGAKKANWKPCFEWSLTCAAACRAVELLRPYLRIKHRQADLVLELGVLQRRHTAVLRRWDRGLNDAIQAEAQKLKDQTLLLNHRGIT
jgi:hypothetical protein